MIIRKILRLFWILTCWVVLLIAVSAAVLGIYALYRINSHIRHHVLAELEKRFPELDIAIGQVRLDESKGITISDLEFSIPDHLGRPKRPLLHVKSLFLACPVTIQSLYKQEIKIKKAVINQPIVRLTRTADGGFSELERFRSSQESSFEAIPVEIIGGIVFYDDVTVPQAVPLKITGVTLTATPPEDSKRPLLLSDLENKSPKPDRWNFSGSADGEMFRQLTFEGCFDPETRHWEWFANCRQFYWTSEYLAFLRQKKPIAGNSDYQRSLESFQGRFDFGISALADPEAPLRCRFAVEGTLFQGSAVLYEIDRTLSELNARFRVTDDGIEIEKLSGIGEAARLTLSYSQEGLLEKRGSKLTASIKGLDFDEHFVESLHPFLNAHTKQLLARYEYAGRTDLDTELNFQNGSWKPKFLSLGLSDLHFSFREFPYKVERLTGNFHVDETAKLAFNLVTKPEEPLKATIVGEYENVFVDPVGQVRIVGENVPIDAKLMNAIPEEQRNVVAQLRPAGRINAVLLIKLPPNDAPLEKVFEIGLDNIAVEYANFPYPLSKICGILRLDGDRWTFADVVGSNGSAVVKCNGHLMPLPGREAGELLIRITANELPVDEQLSKALLDTHQRDLLASFQVKGKVDIEGEVRYLSNDRKINLRFCAVPCPGLSLQPERFPYRVDDVQGQFFYENGNIHSKMLTAKNRKTQIRTGLECRFSPDGQWMLRLSPLTIYQLDPDHELLDAMPSNMRRFHENLKVGKPLNVNGAIEFSKRGDNQPLLTVWDVGLVLHQNCVHPGFPVENIFGEVRLTGYAIDEAFRVAGELNIRSATLQGYPIAQLTGPFFFDGMARNRFYIGQEEGQKLPPAPPEVPVPAWFRQSPWFVGQERARPFRGQFFDGVLYSEGLVFLENTMSYSVKTDLIGADLAKIARHIEPSAQKIAGILNCRTNFYGNGRTMETLGGKGIIQLRNANIYEAPGMIRLLRELSIRETDPNAGTFSAADINFRIVGPQMRLDKITFEGGAFLLTGDGELRLDTRQMNLFMKTRLGNKRWQIPGISDILGGAGDQFIQLNVHGPISDPTVTRIALPEIQKAIRSIQGEETEEYAPTPGPKNSGPSRLFQWQNRPF